MATSVVENLHKHCIADNGWRAFEWLTVLMRCQRIGSADMGAGTDERTSARGYSPPRTVHWKALQLTIGNIITIAEHILGQLA